jgi:hypothetical protein
MKKVHSSNLTAGLSELRGASPNCTGFTTGFDTPHLSTSVTSAGRRKNNAVKVCFLIYLQDYTDLSSERQE